MKIVEALSVALLMQPMSPVQCSLGNVGFTDADSAGKCAGCSSLCDTLQRGDAKSTGQIPDVYSSFNTVWMGLANLTILATYILIVVAICTVISS